MDPDDTTIRAEEWWDSLVDPGPEPYNSAAWAYTVSEQAEQEVIDGQTLERRMYTIDVYDSLASAPYSDPSGASSLVEDVPPGALLGTLSYETIGGTLTVTDWKHENWGDDSPVLAAAGAMLASIPAGVSEARVPDSPHAFWTSLGFNPDYKGDPYLHIHL